MEPAAAISAPAPAPVVAPSPAVDRTSAPDKAERGDWEEPGSESLWGAILKMFVVLALVVALAWLTLNVGLRKLLKVGPAQAGLVRVHERIPLEPKKSVYVVEAAGQFLLLGVGEREVTRVGELDPEKARALLSQRAELATESKPFWDRLLVKPPNKRQSGGEPPREGPA